jgi:hypothetical protein
VRPEGHSRPALSPRIVESRREQGAADPVPLPLGDDRNARQMALTGNDGAGAVGGTTGEAERDAYETLALGCDEDPRAVLARPAAQVFDMATQPAVGVRGPPKAEYRLELRRICLPDHSHRPTLARRPK